MAALFGFFQQAGRDCLLSAMNKEEFEPSELGSPQGGVISPLIANVYLNEFDQEMMKRGHAEFFADSAVMPTTS